MLHVPISALWKMTGWIRQRVAAIFLVPSYRIAHEDWAKRDRLGARWQRLSEGVEYSLHLMRTVDPKPQLSKIALRTVGDLTVKHLSLVFEVESDVAIHQQPIEVFGLTPKPVICTLPNIPVQELFVGKRADPRSSWDSLRFRDIVLQKDSATTLREPDSITSHLTYSWFLNSTWVWVGERLLNIDLIQECKRNLAIYWRFRFGAPYRRVYVRGPVKQTRSVRRLVDAASRPISAMMGSNAMVTVQFWLAIWSGLFEFDGEGKLRRRGRSIEERGSTQGA